MWMLKEYQSPLEVKLLTIANMPEVYDINLSPKVSNKTEKKFKTFSEIMLIVNESL